MKDEDKRNGAYRTVLEELDPNKFSLVLQDVLNQFSADEELQDFDAYISQYYIMNYQYWAYYFRRHSIINFDDKVASRLDEVIFHLLRLIRDRLFDRLIMVLT